MSHGKISEVCVCVCAIGLKMDPECAWKVLEFVTEKGVRTLHMEQHCVSPFDMLQILKTCISVNQVLLVNMSNL